MCVNGLPTLPPPAIQAKHVTVMQPIMHALTANTTFGIARLQLPNQMLHAVRAHGVPSGVQRTLHEVWIVVCLAAVHAMWCTAKKVMDPRGRPVMAAQPRGLHAVAVQSAVAQFWELLCASSPSTLKDPWRVAPIAAARHTFPTFSKCCSSVACQ
jgi:hypothetical protein